MSASPGVPRLHLVTDDEVLAGADFATRAAEALEVGGGAVALHLRGRSTPGAPLLALARRLAGHARRQGGWLLVNDRVDVAAIAGAHGVHLGECSLPVEVARGLLEPGAVVGVSRHDARGVASACAAGATYAFIGAVFATPSHPGRAPGGAALVRSAVEAARGVPIVGIGGITPADVRAVRAAGAHGVAVVRGVWRAPCTGAAVEAYLEALEADIP